MSILPVKPVSYAFSRVYVCLITVDWRPQRVQYCQNWWSWPMTRSVMSGSRDWRRSSISSVCSIQVGTRGYTAGPLWVLCRYSLDILKVHCRYTIHTLWVYHRYTVVNTEGTMMVYCSYIIGTLPIPGKFCYLLKWTIFRLCFNISGVNPDFMEIKFSWINHNLDIYNVKTMKNLVVWGIFEICNSLSFLQ